MTMVGSIGGLNGALSSAFAILITFSNSKTFYFKAVTKNLKIQNGCDFVKITDEQFWNRVNSQAMECASIPFKTDFKDYLAYVCIPNCFCRRRRKLFKRIDKGAARFDDSTDILNIMRLQTRIQTLEKLFLSRSA